MPASHVNDSKNLRERAAEMRLPTKLVRWRLRRGRHWQRGTRGRLASPIKHRISVVGATVGCLCNKRRHNLTSSKPRHVVAFDWFVAGGCGFAALFCAAARVDCCPRGRRFAG